MGHEFGAWGKELMPGDINLMPLELDWLQMSSRRPLELDNEPPESPKTLQNRILADCCSEINDFKGGGLIQRRRKTGRADAPGRVREGLLVSNNTKILRY